MDFYTLKETGRILDLPPNAVSNIVRVMGLPTTSRGFPGTARWLTRAQVEEIAARLGIEIAWPEAATV